MEAGAPATAVEQERVIASLPEELRELGRHVLLGKFNRRGDPVGFHHAPGGRCPPGRRIKEILERFPDGSYSARVLFLHPRFGWLEKAHPHTMFPDEWSSEKVMRVGMEAYRRRTEDWVDRWKSQASRPRIAGYHRRGRGPTTFYPDLGSR
ncbi:MAG: EndoU domain-containing protein [Candidatus Dormibacteraeota bacterium]|nr:EndoU domain-containing protein [Candidatus Dormibacteraeota bacterium]MBO0746475.1 EndoU domain-containing protein [Candidatus Dormibacteraeota bacterium]